MKSHTTILMMLSGALSALLLTSCAAPVSNDFRARLWERCYVAGQKEFRSGHHQAALGLYEEALKQSKGFDASDDRRADSLIALADCLMAMKQADRARPMYETVVKQSVDFMKAGGRPEIWLLLQGRALTGLGDCQRLSSQFPQAVETYKLAIATLEKAGISADHGYDVGGFAMGSAFDGLADSLLATGKVAEAITPLSEAAKISDWTVGKMDWKEALRQKYVSALWAAGKDNVALSESPSAWSAPMHQAIEAASRGDVKGIRSFSEEAETFLMGNADTPPARAVTNLYLAMAAYHEGKFAEAVEAAKAGLEARGKHTYSKVDQVTADLYCVLGLSEEGLGKLQEAAQHLRTSVDIETAANVIYPMHTAAKLAQLAAVEQKLGNKKEAEHAIERAQNLSDGAGKMGWSLGVVHYWMARYYADAGDKTTARKLLEDALPRMDKRPNHVVMARAKQLLSSL